MSDEPDRDWLVRSLRDARKKVAAWPEWKREAFRVLPEIDAPERRDGGAMMRERIEALLGTGAVRQRYETDPVVRAVVSTAVACCWSRDRMLEAMVVNLDHARELFKKGAEPMTDETRTTKVHRIEVLVIDHDDLGADGVREVIENTRYPNRCIHPDVKRIDTREVEWSDEHPLNHYDTADAAYRELFKEEPSR